ncbi:TPA: hypothetical protein N0F65_008139 [Lagenidium giganteum]|uniref:Peptidase M14 domain-containing protein n=1 Tax=Lagenidium giganteum TaxID=4803 RepID=A0AAV2YJ47_9STRA|nr:TPA: hypothetical protein N0F65_008139 [Lagenidium giganteum]
MLRQLGRALCCTLLLTAYAPAPSHGDVGDARAIQQYKYRSYGEIVDYITALEKKYLQYTELFTAQERYGLPVRRELMCRRSGKKEPCLHHVLKITDKASLPDPERPEVFFSGALHGNERVGPQSVVALAEFLLDHASREDGNPWIKHLVKTRTVVIMPTTNAYGYDRNVREERGIDPNRDFDYLKRGKCFETMVARAVNEVWRDHLFQLAITFHGGIRSVSYEWGTTNHQIDRKKSEKSPDHRAQWYMGLGLSRFGGRFEEDDEYYDSGPMNDVVYAVNGGMEDWGYAASWENEFTKPKPIGICTPKTYDGYPAAKSKYNNATNRAFNILVETSFDKRPKEASLGNSSALSDSALAHFGSESIGHVPRNVRMALMFIDLVQPYIAWKHHPRKSSAGSSLKFKWEVLGSIAVDSTQLLVSKHPDMSDAVATTAQSGVTRWYHPDFETSRAHDNNGLFHELLTFDDSGTYYIQAVATVDQDWTKQGTGADAPVPNVPPQTHIVNARTNDDWDFSSNGRRVKGRTVWKSSVRFALFDGIAFLAG